MTTLVVVLKPRGSVASVPSAGGGNCSRASARVTLDFAAARSHRSVRSNTARLSRRRGQPLLPALRSAARAALRPHTPWTPPPGLAPALPRYRFSMGVSARPNPGVGRKISCWYSCDVPPLTAPVCKFASLPSRSEGRCTTLSTRAHVLFRSTGRRACQLTHRRPVSRQMRVSPGTLGPGGRSAGVAVICPNSMNGRSGTVWYSGLPPSGSNRLDRRRDGRCPRR